MKPMTSIAALSALTILLAACATSGSAGTVPPGGATPEPSVAQGSPDLTAEPSAGPSGSPAPSTDPSITPPPSQTPPEGTTVVRAYFYYESVSGSSGLVPILREVPATKAVATAAVAALLDGPTETESGAMSSAVPADTKLLGLTVKDGVATVDLSSEFESGAGSASATIRLGQVVYTLTQFPTVKSVVFQVDGRTVTVFGSEGIVLDGPVGRADYLDLLPTIFVDRPAYGAALGNPGRVTGSAQGLFEATFRVELRDASGRAIADQQAMAACFCESGAFDLTIAYDVSKAQWGTLRVFDLSAKDGSPENIREYPVWLTPR
jgi:sporulation and spore germination protein/immunoglobulin-like protein involved in spore germination